jgi:hypothetical protein
LGVPFGNIPFVSRSNYKFLEVDLRINESRAYHALAIDEHREAFSATLWTKTIKSGAEPYPPRSISDVEQRWFVGAHADVGGGYDNGLLAQVPLEWLMNKAKLHGLKFNDTVIIDDDEKLDEVHNSFAEMAHGAYCAAKLWRPYYRQVGGEQSVSGSRTTNTIMKRLTLRFSTAGVVTQRTNQQILRIGPAGTPLNLARYTVRSWRATLASLFRQIN